MVAAALICGKLSAQEVVDFESVSLTPESYNNGSDGSGNFVFGMVELTNIYDAGWGSWNGFSASNITDNTTAGWGNQYSSFTGSGRSSANYGIYYPEGMISATPNQVIDSFYITNSTFSAISMRDGDAFGKQFGSIYAADGTTVDGTNGEDFFRVWVIAEDIWGGKDSMLVYLADYRFANSSEDYILEEWLKVDVAGLHTYTSLISFRFESSDMGAWGINTPTYFAIDDIYHSPAMNVFENTTLTVDVYPNPINETLNIKGENGILRLLDVKGNLILAQEHMQYSVLNTSNLSNGIYFIELTNSNGKFIQKIIK